MSEFTDVMMGYPHSFYSDWHYVPFVKRVRSYGTLEPCWQEDDENPTHAMWDGASGGVLKLDDDDIVAIRMRYVE